MATISMTFTDHEDYLSSIIFIHSFIHSFMFIRTNSMQNVDRITRDMQDRKVIQDSYNCPKSLH